MRAGQAIQPVIGPNAAWGYLSVSGGLDVPLVLGSASTYLRGGFGGLEGRPLRAGDRLEIPAGVRHGAIVGGSGAKCVEAAVR